MKTCKFFKTLAIMLGMLMSVSLVACGDDDDEPDEPDAPKTSLQVICKVDLAQAWYDYFDVEATYTGLDGVTHTETITANKVLYNETVESSKVKASAVSLTVVAKVRNPLPEVPADQIFALDNTCEMDVYKYTEGESSASILDIQGGVPEKSSINSENMIKRVAKEKTFCNYSYTFSK